MSTVQTITEALPSLALRPGAEKKPENENNSANQQPNADYRYARLLPVFPKDEHYDPLTPFDHVDPGARALSHPNPRSFLDNAQVSLLTPRFGSEVRGVNLAQLDDAGRDQLALEVRTRAHFTSYLRYHEYIHNLPSPCAHLVDSLHCSLI